MHLWRKRDPTEFPCPITILCFKGSNSRSHLDGSLLLLKGKLRKILSLTSSLLSRPLSIVTCLQGLVSVQEGWLFSTFCSVMQETPNAGSLPKNQERNMSSLTSNPRELFICILKMKIEIYKQGKWWVSQTPVCFYAGIKNCWSWAGVSSIKLLTHFPGGEINSS